MKVAICTHGPKEVYHRQIFTENDKTHRHSNSLKPLKIT